MLCRSYLFMPGNRSRLLQKIGEVEADAVILDLEDGVPPPEKEAARRMIAARLQDLPGRCPRLYVRINSPRAERLEDDLKVALHPAVAGIVIPKVDTAADVLHVETLADRVAAREGVDAGALRFQPTLETARAILNAPAIAAASRRVEALTLGAEDFTLNIGAERTAEGWELFQARAQLILAAKAAGVQAVDAVFSDLADEEGFRREAVRVRELGFDGKQVIHPRQVSVVNDVFSPTEKQLEFARKVVDAYEQALADNTGVILVDGRMVDPPVVDKARRLLAVFGS